MDRLKSLCRRASEKLPASLRGRDDLWFIALVAVGCYAIWPLWAVRRVPIQDLPQHLAAIRVLHDFHDPTLGFDRYFSLSLLRTQYLAYYLVVHLLSFVTSVTVANKLVLSVSLIGTLLAAWSLLGDLGKNRALALFLAPILWNAHLILGFVNFVAAIPLALLMLSLGVRCRDALTRRRGVLLALVSLLAFYTHVVPFALSAAGVAWVALGRDLRQSARRLLPLVPSALALAVWFKSSPSGASVGGALNQSSALSPLKDPGARFTELPNWVVNVVRDGSGPQVLVGLAVLVVIWIALATPAANPEDDESLRLRQSLARRIGMLAPLSLFGYFALPSGHDWIWPIAGRFPLLALVFLVIALPASRHWSARALPLAPALLGIWSTAHVTEAFKGAERDELAGLGEALASIPKGERVAGLIFDPGSRFVQYNPYLHAVANYQAERGGAVMFTFADFPASPIRFREDQRPPRVPPRWEWTPSSVRPDADLAWFDWVLCRGGPGSLAQSRRFVLTFERNGWRVYKKSDVAPND